jgi:hypothetical protein
MRPRPPLTGRLGPRCGWIDWRVGQGSCTSTCSSSAPVSLGSAPLGTCNTTAQTGATRFSSRARRWAAPGTSSATQAFAPTPTCTRSGIASARGVTPRQSPMAPPSNATSRRRRASTGLTGRFAMGIGWCAPSGLRRRRSGESRRSTMARPCTSPAASCIPAPATMTTRPGILPSIRGGRVIPDASCTRSIGLRISITPASVSW